MLSSDVSYGGYAILKVFETLRLDDRAHLNLPQHCRTVLNHLIVQGAICSVGPGWRNWQTQRTQNPPTLAVMGVRPPLPAPR
jgi:hypothetical protein